LTAIVTDPRRDETTVFPRSNDSMYSSVVSGWIRAIGVVGPGAATADAGVVRVGLPAGRQGQRELVVGRLGEAVMGPRREPSATRRRGERPAVVVVDVAVAALRFR